MKFSEVVLISNFLSSSMRRWKDAKTDIFLAWQSRCQSCQLPLFGEQSRCLTCYNLWIDEMEQMQDSHEICDKPCCQEEASQPEEMFYIKMIHGLAVKCCSVCENPADRCLCDGEDVYIGCLNCGHNCYNGDYPQWKLCSSRCMRAEARMYNDY